ncbi:TonB-dependent receptor [Cytophagaceae bacterium 50C-KIRBA]|uniref:TonB-dependent receptor n=1 Tax=Aquirufa beregesia TaxID=2516556 RepID=A0ABX0F3I1_9BACT|nr:TonB-dependent receptor [Aquirufa beregesia]NGZ44415.1 TonB-dependent receptor [Aquirufa beregesia]
MKKLQLNSKNLWLMMKVTLGQLCLILFCTTFSFASEIQAQEVLDRSITIVGQNVNLKSALSQIEKQAEVKFVYSTRVQINQKLNLNIHKAKLSAVLSQILLPNFIEFEVIENRILLTKARPEPSSSNTSNFKLEQEESVMDARSVKGKVVDETGDPIPGANILIKGTSKGVSSAADGMYSIVIPDDKAILVFSFVGYITQEIEVGMRGNLNVILKSENKSLAEVVVVGYGTSRAKDLTGSVATINQNTIKDLPVSSVDQKMIGQVAGVQIQQLSGAPGAGTSVRIRGSGSLGAGNEPLYVIDGMPYSAGLNQDFNPLLLINPNDIESISVLKDASSTAIYGSRGANGVIMITTKKGQYGRLQINFSSMSGVQMVPKKGRPEMMNQREFVNLQRNKIDIAVLRAENRKTNLSDYPLEYQNPEQLVGNGTDWYDLLLQSAPIQEHNLSIQKGTQDSKINASLGYFKQDGALKYTGLERFSGKIGFESNLSKTVAVGGNLQVSFVNQNRTNTNLSREDVIGVSLWANPLMSPYDSNGQLIPYIKSPQSKYHSAWSFANPLYVLQQTAQLQKQFQSLGSVFVEWNILPDLKFKTSLNTIYASSKYNQFVPSTVGSSNTPPVNGTGRSSNSRSENFNWLVENTLAYNKMIERHRFSALVGYTTQKSSTSGISLNASPYSNDLIQTINASQAISSWGEQVEAWSLISYLGRINYSFADKYLVTATFRSDGSSRFGSKNRYASFPSVGLAWRISEEGFMKNNKVISSLKWRASYGKSGNNNIGNYSSLASINPGAYIFGSNQVAASFVGVSNPYLTWEESNQMDTGLDIELFNNRINLTLDYYNRESNNMLLNDVIPAITGFNSQIVNKGTVRNRGFEISIGANPIANKFNWDMNLNVAINRNMVLSLNDNGDRVLSGNNDNNPTHVTVVGKPIGQFFGFIQEGVYSAADIANPNIVKTAQVYEGNPKYKDVNGDGVISDFLDYTIIGNPHPDFIYGFTNNFSFKNFTLGVILNGQYGGQVMNGLRQTTDNLQGFFNVSKEFVNRWRSADNPGDPMLYGVPKLTPSWGHRVNSRWVEDATFLRVSNVTLGYSFPSSIIKRTKLFEACRIYITSRNLAMFTKYQGANPEAQSRNIDNTLSPGFDMSSYPLATTTSIGVNLSF